ncbi:MAG: hypothetical protein WC505_01025 [Patescibacteria group bacterium]
MSESKTCRVIIGYNPGSTSAEVFTADIDQFPINGEFIDKRVLEFPDNAAAGDRQSSLLRYIKFIAEKLPDPSGTLAVCGIATRGAILVNALPGVTRVDEPVLRACARGHFGTIHVCNNAPTDGFAVAQELGIQDNVFFADPVSGEDPAYNQACKMSGIKGLPIESHGHYLALREMIASWAQENRINACEANGIFIYAGGGGFSIAAVRKGKIIAVSNPNQIGPPGITRCCDVPSLDFARYIHDLARNDGKDFGEIAKLLLKRSGLMSHLGHLGVTDFKDIIKLARQGNEEVLEVLDRWYLRIAEEVGKRLVDIGFHADVLYWSGKMTAAAELTEGVYVYLEDVIPINRVNAEDLEMQSLARQAILAYRGLIPVNRYAYEG